MDTKEFPRDWTSSGFDWNQSSKKEKNVAHGSTFLDQAVFKNWVIVQIAYEWEKPPRPLWLL